MKKKIVISLMVLVIGSIFTTMFLAKDKKEVKNKKEKNLLIEKKRNINAQEKRRMQESISFENLDGLFFFGAKELEEFKKSIQEWLYDEGVTPKKIEIYEKIEELDQGSWKFYCLVNSGSYKVEGVFKFDKEVKFAFTDTLPKIEEIESVAGKQPTEEEKALVNESYDPGYENVDVGKIVIVGGKEKIPKEVNQEKLIEKMTGYLLEAQEYRREVILEEVQKDEDRIGLVFSFVIPRIDKKVFCVTIKNEKYKFFFGTRIEE